MLADGTSIAIAVLITTVQHSVTQISHSGPGWIRSSRTNQVFDILEYRAVYELFAAPEIEKTDSSYLYVGHFRSIFS